MSPADPEPLRRLLARLTTTRALLVVVTLASAAPLFSSSYLPFTDWPEHVAVIATVRHWYTPAFQNAEIYTLALGRSQYLLFHAVGALVAWLVGSADLATRLLLAATAIALPWTFVALLRSLGRDPRLAVFAPFLFWSRALTVGFLPFVASIPVMIGALALAVREARAPRRARAVVLAVLAVVLFYLHLSTYLLLVACAATLTVLVGRFDDRRARAWQVLLRLRWLAPSVLLAIVWTSHARLAVQSESLDGPGEIERLGVGRALYLLPLWASDLFAAHGDEVCSIVWWTAYVVVVVTGMAFARRRMFLVSAAPLAITGAIYLATPFQVGAGGMLNVRLAPIVALFALLPLKPRRSAWGEGALLAAAVATLAMSINSAHEIRATVSEELGDIDGLLAHTTPGSRLLTLSFDARSKRMLFPPWLHVGAYHRAAKGGVSSFSFTELPHWPLAYRKGAAPPKKNEAFWDWTPCTYRNEADGPYYDFVLVRGPVNPFVDRPPGPAFHAVATTRAFTLYAKTPGESWSAWEEQDDAGPCRERDGTRTLPLAR